MATDHGVTEYPTLLRTPLFFISLCQNPPAHRHPTPTSYCETM